MSYAPLKMSANDFTAMSIGGCIAFAKPITARAIAGIADCATSEKGRNAMTNRFRDPAIGFWARSQKPNIVPKPKKVSFSHERVPNLAPGTFRSEGSWFKKRYQQIKCAICGTEFMARLQTRQKLCSKACVTRLMLSKRWPGKGFERIGAK